MFVLKGCLRHILYLTITISGCIAGNAQYISEVLKYMPAPGQYINSSPWGIPHSTESITGGINGSLCLGSFGGYVVFRFDGAVDNDPGNPYGVDFIIFGNALEDFSEPGIVSVMKDDNNNGIADDIWYELAGSNYYFSSTRKNYEVTYFNKGNGQNVPWNDNQGNGGYIYANSFHTQNYYPDTDSFPHVPSDAFTLYGTCIHQEPDTTEKPFIKLYRKAFGYADNQPRGAAPYHVPDNPYTRVMENAGGDSFDIDWAVDQSGNYVDLDKIHFIKVHNAVLGNTGWLGELSTEITGAVDVMPDNSISGVIDMIVLKDIPEQIDTNAFQLEVFVFQQGRLQSGKHLNWLTDREDAYVDNEHILRVKSNGKVTITAELKDNPEIKDSVSTYVNMAEVPTHTAPKMHKPIYLYPNPAQEFIMLEGSEKCTVIIHNTLGRQVMHIPEYEKGYQIPVGSFSEGIYLLTVKNHCQGIKGIKFIKK